MQELTDTNDWQKVLEQSSDRPVMVLKHSTTCPISAGAWEEFESFVDEHDAQNAECFFVKVIESRSVSNQIAESLRLKHESPQAILIKNKEPVWSTTHSNITKRQLTENLNATF